MSELPGTKTVTIGKIAGAHGVRGEFRIVPLTDFPSRFEEMDRLELYSPEGWHKMSLDIVSMRFQEGKGVYLAKASGIVDRDDAEAMKGLSIKIPAQERVTLPEDSFWVDDILGLSVEDEESGEILGVICEIFPTGGNDVYVVKTPEGSQKMLPAIREVVRLVDLERGVILVRLLDGLWD
ncbi:MAG: Ribosome maturation factor RimM [Synergistales bacterium 54_9]|nr:MAG: Ribosome maturation factor RimM [Synergistales bacterium 54_9]MDN5336026.1 rRNA processing protein RimM [Synergistales bacterium]